MNRLIRYIDKEDFYLLFIALFSLAMIVIFEFIAYDCKEIIPRGAEISDLIVNLSLSFIAGWVIYLVTAFIPKIRARERNYAVLLPIFEGIVNDFESVITNAVIIPNQERNLPLFEQYLNSPLSIPEADLSTLIASLDHPVISEHRFHPNAKYQVTTYIKRLVYHCLENRDKHLSRTERCSSLMNAESLQLLDKIEHSEFIKRSEEHANYFNAYVLSSVQDFNMHYKAVVELKNYIEHRL